MRVQSANPTQAPLRIVPLTSPPESHTVWQASTPWQTIRSMLLLVIVCFFISQIAVFVAAGFFDGDLNGTLGPVEPAMSFVASICMAPFLLFFFYLRRPNLTHTINAHPHPQGSNTHVLQGNRLVQSPVPTVVTQHIVRSTAPLEMPRPLHLWGLFIGGITLSTLCLLPMTLLGLNALTGTMALLVVIPAWLIGFSAPVFAWWSITSRHMGITITRRDAEWVLAAGMLSTVPAIIINSITSPIMLSLVGLDAFEVGSWGEGLILFGSAPIGEELCKAFAVLCLTRLIVSPKHGFYVGSTVGLGFALLENAQYIIMALSSEYSGILYPITALLRGLSSIPGHALWTGITGYAIGCWLARGNRVPTLTSSPYLSEKNISTWVLYDKKTGSLLPTTLWGTMPSQRMIDFLGRRQKSAWPLPKTVPVALGLAMLGHALWNGSSWALSRWVTTEDSLTALFIDLGWLFSSMVILWLCIVRLLPTAVLDS